MGNESIVRADFDRIAALGEAKWDHNLHYHKYLQKFIPAKLGAALDIGCGTGDFSRLLAGRAEAVTGIDLSPEMIKKALELSKEHKNIEYRIENIMEYSFEANKYDCVVSIAAAHHLPIKEMLEKIRMALKPGGVLLILDLYKRESAADILMTLAAIPTNLLCMLIKTGRLKRSKEETAAWNQHGKHDKYLTLKELEHIYNPLLPGHILKRHLFWRYSLVWRK